MTYQLPTDLMKDFNSRQAEIFRSVAEARDEHTSKGIFRHLVDQVTEFEEALDTEHEVGAMLASFGQAITLHVNRLSFIYPKLIVFDGLLEGGESARLVQHVGQLSFLLLKVKRLNPSEPRLPIGFGPWPEGA